MPAAGRASLSVEGAAGRPGARRAVRLICADPGGRRTGFRRESPLSRIERGRRGGLLIAESRMLSRVVAGGPAASSTDVVLAGVSRRWRSPSRSRRARGRRRRRRSCGACRARCRGAARCGAGAAGPARRSRGRAAGWPAWRRASASPLARRAAVVPGGLDQQPAGVPEPDLVIAPWRRLLAGAVLGRDEAEVAHQLPGAREALEVADLGAQPDRRERVDAAQAAQPGDRLGPRRVGDQLGRSWRSSVSRRTSSASIAPR